MNTWINCTFFYLTLILPSFAMLIDGQSTMTQIIDEQAVRTTPFNESKRRGQEQDYAQGVGQIRISGLKSTTLSTGTLITPDLVITCAHSVAHITSQTQALFTVTINGETFSRRISKVFMQTATILKNMNSDSFKAQDDDIAIIRLESSIDWLGFLPFTTVDTNGAIRNTIASGHQAKFIGVSAVELTQNAAPSITCSTRHVGIFTLVAPSLSSQKFLTSKMWLPADYKLKAHDSPVTDKCVPEFAYSAKNGIPLHASLMPGDSGGPLIAKINGSLQIVGIASGQSNQDAFDQHTKTFKPNGIFENHWVPIYNHLWWIQLILEQQYGIDYHQELKARDSGTNS